MGKDYDAAVICSGTCGFGMGGYTECDGKYAGSV